jgi:inosine-uridine nucleoside N-ribohydrolase
MAFLSVLGLAVMGLAVAEEAAAPPKPGAKIPVILDTDIGGDIDDTWALALLLKSPELDLKMVVSDTGDTVYRAKVSAKLLEVAKRTDVAVAVGIRQNQSAGPQAPWVSDYDLAKYPGKVHENGVDALIEMIMASPQPITLLCIGPVPNIKAALAKQPEIAKKARFVGMHGSVRKGYNGGPKPQPEYNVKQDVKACQAAFTAAWPMIITPLDTCGIVHLRGDKYRKVAESDDPIADQHGAAVHWRDRRRLHPRSPARQGDGLRDVVEGPRQVRGLPRRPADRQAVSGEPSRCR